MKISKIGATIGWFFFVFIAVAMLLGAIQAGGYGVLVYFVFGLLSYLSMLISMVPFGGAVLQWFVLNWAMNGLFGLAKLEVTWATQVVFWIPMALGILINIFFSGLLLIGIFASRKR
jgi:hypothetical protein